MAIPEARVTKGAALGDYLRMIWLRRWIVLAAVVVATALAIATRPAEPPPLYTATATLRVQTFSFRSTGETGVVATEGVPPAEVTAARSVDVAAETAEELGIDDGGADLLSRLSVIAQEDTDLMQISLTGEGLRTVRMLEAYTENYVAFRNEQDEAQLARAVRLMDEAIARVDTRLRELSAQVTAEDVIGEPSPETRTKYDTVSLQYSNLVDRKELLTLDAALAGNEVELIGSPIVQRLGSIPTRALRVFAGPLVGLLLGCAIAVGLGVLRPRVAGRDRTEEQLGYPVLAVIPRVKNRRVSKDPLLLQRSSGWAAEAMRMLRTELQLVEERGGTMRTVVVTSPEPRDGKSTVAANLASSYAHAGRRTVLVHADLRAEARDKGGRGLTDYIAGLVPEVPVQRHPGGFMRVVSGSLDKVSAGRVQTGLVAALRELARSFEVVVVDTPPLLAFADAVLLASEADAVVMVLRDGKTMEDKAADALDVLIRHDAAVAGIVLNATSVGRLERRRYRRYYGAWAEAEHPAPHGPSGEPWASQPAPREPAASPLVLHDRDEATGSGS